jgi:L-iditol 2-dehydrogenase
MKALDLVSLGQFKLEERMKPIPKVGEVLVKIRACGICGSDIPRAFINGPYHYPTVLGHEFSGEVVELGNGVSEKYLGKHVAVFPLIPCGECEYCHTGNFAQCQNYSYFGSRTDGGFQEFITVPIFNLVLLKDNVNLEEGAMMEPATVAQHVVNKGEIGLGDNVVIYGAGTIGMIIAQWAKLAGASKVILIDIDETKVEFAKEVGLEFVCNSLKEDSKKYIESKLDGKLADVVVEATGSSAAFNQCVDSIRTFGKVVLLGNPHSEMKVEQKVYDHFMRKEGQIVSIFNSVYERYPKNEWKVTAAALASGELDLKPLITHRVPIENLKDAFDMVHEKKEFYCKVLMVTK